MYQNKGPVKFEKLVHQDRAGGFEPRRRDDGGQFDTTHQFPQQFIAQAKAAPMLTVTEAKPNFQLLYFGFKTSRPMVADKRVREAMSIAINRAEIAKGILLGNADPAFTFVDPSRARLRQSTRPKHGQRRTSSAPRSCSTRPAGSPAPTASAKRTASSWRPRSTTPQAGNSPRVAEAIQGYLRKIGVHWQLQPWDSTIAAAKMAEQDYEIWSVTVPYLSAGDLMNIYFDSRNIPTPNRMNWKDAETDEWLHAGPRRAERRRIASSTTSWCRRR